MFCAPRPCPSGATPRRRSSLCWPISRRIQFLPQTVPSFSAQTAFRNFREYYPQFFYKEAALNPTNPADLARDWERDLIEKLRANPELTKDISIRTTDTGPQYTATYPLVIRNENLPRLPLHAGQGADIDGRALRHQERLRLEA